MGETIVPDPFIKKSKLIISLDKQSEILQSLFLFYVLVEVYQNVLKLRCTNHLVLPFIKLF